MAVATNNDFRFFLGKIIDRFNTVNGKGCCNLKDTGVEGKDAAFQYRKR